MDPKEICYQIITTLRELDLRSLDISHLKGLLNDLLINDREKRLHINLIINFAETSQFHKIINEEVVDRIMFNVYARQFREDYGVSKENSFWALMVWVFALKLLPDSEFDPYYKFYESSWKEKVSSNKNEEENHIVHDKSARYKFLPSSSYSEAEIEFQIKRTFEDDLEIIEGGVENGAFFPNDYQNRIRSYIKECFSEVIKPRRIYEDKPILLVIDDDEGLNKFLEDLCNSCIDWRIQQEKYFSSPMFIVCENSADKFWEAVKLEVLRYSLENRRFRRKYSEYLLLLWPDHPGDFDITIETEQKSLKNKITFYSLTLQSFFQLQLPFRRTSRKVKAKQKTEEVVLKEFFNRLSIEFPISHPGIPIILFVRDVHDISRFQEMINEVMPDNGFLRVISHINVVNFTKTMMNLDKEASESFRKGTKIYHFPLDQKQKEEKVNQHLKKNFKGVDFSDEIIKGLTFLSLGSISALKEIISDDAWEIINGELFIHLSALQKYFRASKYLKVLYKHEELLDDLEIGSTIFKEDVWQFQKLFLQNVLKSIHSMNGANEFTFQHLLTALQTCKELVFLENRLDQKILFTRLVDIFQRYEIIEEY